MIDKLMSGSSLRVKPKKPQTPHSKAFYGFHEISLSNFLDAIKYQTGL